MPNVYSIEYAAEFNTVPRVRTDPNKAGYKQSKYWSYVQAGAGNVDDVLFLMRIPAGSRLLLPECAVWIVGGPATTVLDFGYGAYTEPDGDAVAASANGLVNDIDIVSDGIWFGNIVGDTNLTGKLGADLTYYFNSRQDVDLTLTVRTAALADLDALRGYVTWIGS